MKKLFYYIDICILLSKEEKAFEKIRRCLDIFAENKDSLFIVWAIPQAMRKDLSLLNADVAKGFETILEDFQKREIGEIIETDDLLSVLLACDAYYGDCSDLLYHAKKKGIPAMIEDVNL